VDATIPVRVKAVAWESDEVKQFELRCLDGAQLPAFTAGAHIDVHLPNGLVRSYSLTNSQSERHRYVIGVAKDRNSRGGSRYMHEGVMAGDIISISPPRNNFPLREDSPMTILIAGGIGITPIIGMIHRLEELGEPWSLHYGARNRRVAAFLDLLAPYEDRVNLAFDDVSNGRFLDLDRIIADAPATSDVYCCGPSGMLAAFERATAALPPGRVHREYFSARDVPASSGGFIVELARSGLSVPVPAGRTILAALLEAGIAVPHSCLQGVCGTCETRVISGLPDHRDVILSEAERAAGKAMMICCSGAKSSRLVLDL
jgi:vanillate O-demethylase ferredoxin subunit